MEGGKQYQQLVGSRRQVFNGTAKKTGYGKAALTKKHLKMNKHGRIVSVKKSKASRKNKNLGNFLQKRGSKTFGPVLAKKKGGREITDEDKEKAREAGVNAFEDKKDELVTRNCTDFQGSNQTCIDFFEIESHASSAGKEAYDKYLQDIEGAEAAAAPASEGGKKKAKKSKK